MHRVFTLSAAALVCLLATTSAQAQFNPFGRPGVGQPSGGPYARPTISPYLNLLGNNNPAVNYYLQVLPAFQRQMFEGQVESSLSSLEQRTPTTNDIENVIRNLRLAEPLESTGHPTRFANTGTFFPQPRSPARR